MYEELIVTETKICIKCGEELANTMFNKAKQNKDGLINTCRSCESIKNKQWRKDHKEYKNRQDKLYRESHKEECAEYLKKYNIENKEKHKENGKRWREENKEYKAIKDKEYRAKNIVAREAYEQKYRNNNKEKLRQYRDANKEIIRVRMVEYREINRKKLTDNRQKNKTTLAKNRKAWAKLNPEKIRSYRQIRRSLQNDLPATLTINEWKIIKKIFNNKCAYCGKEKPLTQEHFVPLSKGGEYTNNNIIPVCSNCNSSKNNREFSKWYPMFKYYSKKREKAILTYLGYENEMQQLKIM